MCEVRKVISRLGIVVLRFYMDMFVMYACLTRRVDRPAAVGGDERGCAD